MDANQLKELQKNHLDIWNERDRTKRDSLIALTYADDIRMYDPNFILTSSTQVSDFIDKVQTQDPGFEFTATGDMDYSQNGLRLRWKISLGNNSEDLTGNDFFITEGDRIKHLYVFIDVK